MFLDRIIELRFKIFRTWSSGMGIGKKLVSRGKGKLVRAERRMRNMGTPPPLRLV
jgi:hypothetical protein